jgi:hypothetical protein
MMKEDSLVLNPLVPDGSWTFFCLDRLLYHGRWITIIWDQTGTQYNRGKGFMVIKISPLISSFPPIFSVIAEKMYHTALHFILLYNSMFYQIILYQILFYHILIYCILFYYILFYDRCSAMVCCSALPLSYRG